MLGRITFLIADALQAFHVSPQWPLCREVLQHTVSKFLLKSIIVLCPSQYYSLT